ncbi:hypothetical protein [Rhodococcus sp. 077-4]|uniref:hypothetical protein n=1 Tax=Rhodococcus sp. 077-4 TaxID=2789271 RepID=UPI0039F46E96
MGRSRVLFDARNDSVLLCGIAFVSHEKLTLRTVGRAALVVVAAAATFGSAVPANAEPVRFDGTTTLQIPGVVVAWPLTRGAAVYNPIVEHGSGHIHPAPDGYGYIFTWTNLSTGASGTITDASPDRAAVATGAGQVVVRGEYRLGDLGQVFTIPSIGSFYVSP